MLNDTQQNYLESVRTGEKDQSSVIRDLRGVSFCDYRRLSFQELLFALDSLNTLRGEQWADVFLDGLIENGSLISPSGEVEPEVWATIGQWHLDYGTGCFGMALVIDLCGKAKKVPINSENFVRRVMREYFFGLSPVDDFTLYALKRYFDKKPIWSEDDLEIVLHIVEETKGLDNDPRWEPYVINLVMNQLEQIESYAGNRTEKRLISNMQKSNEIDGVERGLIRRLKDKGLSLPKALIDEIDISRDQLLGIM